MREAEFYTKKENNIVQCNLCHHKCILSPSQIGLCLGKQNINGILYAKNYGKIITLSDDPIEKKPLYHYYPDSYILSIAQSGCNFKCPFCQNSDIAQNEVSSSFLSPENLHNLLLNKNRNMIAFTYTEPLMWYEYIYDFASQFNDIKTIIVSNGCINPQAMERIAPFINAANIDLKSFNNDFYTNELFGNLEYVKENIKILYKHNVHIEITNLLIESKNDNREEFEKMIDFISEISNTIPFHISRYFPSYKYNLPPTSPEKLIEFYNIAKMKLQYVYTGNFADKKYNSTYCPKCNSLLIERDFYNTNILGIENGKCKKCGKKIHLIY